MTSATGSGEKEFFHLAAKVVGGTASAEQKTRLETCVHDNPKLQKAFEHMQALIESDKDDHFLQSAIRVIFKGATPEESKEIESLKTANPDLWRRYCFIQEVFAGLAREAALGDTIQEEPMPDRVRQALRAKLGEAKS